MAGDESTAGQRFPRALADAAGFPELCPKLLYVGLYWGNHHHLLKATRRINGAIIWANLHLLFWLSLIPFATGWNGENHFTAAPAALYGFVLMMCAISWAILQRTIVAKEGSDSALGKATRRDVKGLLPIVLYLIGILLAFVQPWISSALYALIAIIWFFPDRRIERVIASISDVER